MPKSSSVNEISNRKSNRKGQNISIYLRAEDLETLEFLRKVWGMEKRSQVIQFILRQFREWIDIYMPQLLTKGTVNIQDLIETLKQKVKEY